MADIIDLLNHVQLTEAINPSFVIRAVSEGRRIAMIRILDMQQPVVDQTSGTFTDRHLYTAAAVMPADDDVPDPEHIHRVLDNRKTVEVCVDDKVGDITMHKEFARQQTDNLVGGYATV